MYSILIGSTCPVILTSRMIGELKILSSKRWRGKPHNLSRTRDPALIRRRNLTTKVRLWRRLDYQLLTTVFDP